MLEKVLARLDVIIDENAYVKHSFTRALIGGEVSRRGLRDWAVQKYHQTYQQNRGFSAIHARAPHEDVRQWEMEQLIAEETGITDGSDAHYNLMKRFAIAVGAPGDLERLPMAPEVGAFIDYLLGVCLGEHFVFGLLAFYVNERQTPAAVQKMYDHLVGEVGISAHDAEWFRVHGEVDVHHAEGARRLIARYAHEADDFEYRAEEIVRAGLVQWRNLQDFYFRVATAA
jgi:pyrroloquinoline-quinone synthase